MVNCVLEVAILEAKEACRTEQLFGGMEAGIEGESTICTSCGSIMLRRRTGYSTLLKCVTRSMRRIVRKCFDPSHSSGLVDRSSLSNDIATGTPWW